MLSKFDNLVDLKVDTYRRRNYAVSGIYYRADYPSWSTITSIIAFEVEPLVIRFSSRAICFVHDLWAPLSDAYTFDIELSLYF